MTISLNSRNHRWGPHRSGFFSLSAIETTVVGDGTCGDGKGEHGSKVDPKSREGGARGTVGAGGTAAAAMEPARGDGRLGIERYPRTPIASPSYPRLLRYT